MPPPSAPPAVEYKKDGTVSRMRAHKGNVPQLPQTKLCPFCPAKFTRTTHLNRHLRNHTNERLYRCETCGAQFTRSDLLARHKKSCGESHPISRSRRRSCQACAALKVKCDLRHPCSKCQARSRECVYQTESPEDRRSASPARRSEDAHMSEPSKPAPQGVTNVDASAGFDPWAFANSGSFLDPAFPELSLIEEANALMSQPLTEANMAASFGTMRSSSPLSQTRSLPNFDAASSNTASSYTPRERLPSFFQSELAGGANTANLSSFSNDMFEPFFRDIFASSTQNSQNSTPPSGQNDASTPAQAQPSLTDFFQPSPFMFTGGSSGAASETQPFMIDYDDDLMYDMIANTYPQDVPPTYTPLPDPSKTYYVDPVMPHSQLEIPPPPPAEPDVPEPTTEELQKYLYVFLTSFLPQMPIVHTPSLRVELKPPILLRAMQACGALFVKTKTAETFVERTLNTSREVLVSEFAKPSPDPKHQVHIIITVILLQTIGLFHQDAQQRARSNIYHGMLVLMIRQTHVIDRNASWTHQTFPTNDPTVLEKTWRDWAVHETIKRALLLAYCHDRSHPIYFAMPASFHSTEFSIQLPCDEALWTAPTPRAWGQLAMSASPYGTGTSRITGVPMPRALHAVGLIGLKIDTGGSPSPPADMPVIPPFGHFIIMQAIMGELFRRCSTAAPPMPASLTEGEVVNEHVFALQFSLHRWLQMWLNNPECPRPSQGARPSTMGPAPTEERHDPPFMQDPLPFYWLAQLLLLAFQESFPPFGPPATTPSSATSPPSAGGAYGSPHSSGTPSSASSFSSPSMFASAEVLSPQYHVSDAPPQPDTSLAQFTLVKSWQQHIRLFLRRNQGSPTVIWDELMKIRLKGWSADFSLADPRKANTEGCPGEEGLLGFFEEKLKI
ncbi:hypothetical protein DENSPDRAFT_839343 [Dentipellis sp. KUC8613]|nr:hypothetical protein DENSPDRAFT_839343 [Dentipellis sp. KUC8613]